MKKEPAATLNGDVSELLAQWTLGNTVDRAAAEPWIERLRAGAPTILPRCVDGELVLYGLTRSSAESRGLAAELRAAIGPSWSDFNGQTAGLDSADEFERALAAWRQVGPYGPILRARVRPDADVSEVWAALGRLLGVWQRRPPGDQPAVELTARLIADFELALQTGAVDQARPLLEALRARGTISSDNLLFLEVQLLGVGSRFEELLSHPRLDEILNRRHPVRVTAALFEAVHAVYLATYAASHDVAGATDTFAEHVRPRFERLLRSRGPLESFTAIELLLLAAAADGRPAEERWALATAAATTDERERDWLALLSESTLPGVPGADVGAGFELPGAVEDPIAEAQRLLLDGRFDDVLSLARQAPVTVGTVQLLVQAAEELDTLDGAGAVSSAFGELSDEDQVALRRQRLWAAPLERLLAMAGEQSAIGSWQGLLASLGAGTAVRVEEIASRGALEWDPAWPGTPAEAQQLANGLLAVPDQHREALYLTVPHLLTFMDRRSRPPAIRGQVDRALFEVLTYADYGGRIVQGALLVVLDRILEAGVDSRRYAALLGDLEDVWETIRARRTLDWLIDVLGVLAQHPCPANGARRALFQRAVGEALAQRELDEVTLDLLYEIAADTHLSALIEPLQERARSEEPATPANEPPPAPAVIGIYSLSEPEARRAGAILARMFTTTKIEFNHEYDSSPKLEAFAARVDVLAMVTASAKHAATIALRRACPPQRLAEVYVRGSTSIVRAVLGHVTNSAAASG